MKIPMRLAVMAASAVLLAGGCSSPVLKQDIPVSTNPMGAKIYADGQLVGETPASVALDRNRSHILTLVKENYRQEDVVVERRYQRDKSYLKAIESGIDSGLFFGNAGMGIGAGMMSLSEQEETGEAYVLAPPAVAMTLTPLGGAGRSHSFPSGSTAGAAMERRPAGSREAPGMDDGKFTHEVFRSGAGAALTHTNPVEKRVETSSSSRTYVKPDGTRVTEKSSTSVGVGIDPAGLVDVIDTLFK
jgi:hypothetical protein